LVLELVRAAFWLVVVEAWLRGGLPRTCQRLGITLDLSSAAPPSTTPAVLPRRMRTPIRACCIAVRHWPAGDTCLRRCLLIGHRLRALGPVLRIGVRRLPSGEFSAHSWLEIDGHTLDAAAADYQTLGRA
jgi:hypothetical protein